MAKKHLRIECTAYDNGTGKVQAMTGILVQVETGLSFEESKARALGYIVQELSRYGLQEAFHAIGIEPPQQSLVVAVNGRLYVPEKP